MTPIDDLVSTIVGHYRWQNVDPHDLSREQLHRAIALAVVTGIRCGLFAARDGVDLDALNKIVDAFTDAPDRVLQ